MIHFVEKFSEFEGRWALLQNVLSHEIAYFNQIGDDSKNTRSSFTKNVLWICYESFGNTENWAVQQLFRKWWDNS